MLTEPNQIVVTSTPYVRIADDATFSPEGLAAYRRAQSMTVKARADVAASEADHRRRGRRVAICFGLMLASALAMGLCVGLGCPVGVVLGFVVGLVATVAMCKA